MKMSFDYLLNFVVSGGKLVVIIIFLIVKHFPPPLLFFFFVVVTLIAVSPKVMSLLFPLLSPFCLYQIPV